MENTLYILICTPFFIFSQGQKWENEKVSVYFNRQNHVFWDANTLHEERWDMLPQTIFWKEIMLLSPDTCIINVASSREILTKIPTKQWMLKTEEAKNLFKDSLRKTHGLHAIDRIFVTIGKNDFYRFKDVITNLSDGIRAFETHDVDPWYAQAILLIESPGQLKKSSTGAFGPFQLMASVAKSYGLIVNSTIDERADFQKSAFAASRLLKTVCIPEAKQILHRHGISYQENDLWFRLLVMHVYHAGSGNVEAVLSKIKPCCGNQDLIKQLWLTTAGGFGNNSQNYSQLILASQLILEEMIYLHCDDLTSN